MILIKMESKMEAIFCVGVSGSGKSTWAKNECRNHFIIERDICRQEILKSRGWDGKDSMWLLIVTGKQIGRAHV